MTVAVINMYQSALTFSWSWEAVSPVVGAVPGCDVETGGVEEGTLTGGGAGGAGGGPALFHWGGGPLNLSSGPGMWGGGPPGRSRLGPCSGPREFRGSGGPGRGPERGSGRSGGPERSGGPGRGSGGPRRSSGGPLPRSKPRGSRKSGPPRSEKIDNKQVHVSHFSWNIYIYDSYTTWCYILR